MALCVDAVSLERSGRKEERNVSVGVEEGRSDLRKAQNAKNKKKKKPKKQTPLKAKVTKHFNQTASCLCHICCASTTHSTYECYRERLYTSLCSSVVD